MRKAQNELLTPKGKEKQGSLYYFAGAGQKEGMRDAILEGLGSVTRSKIAKNWADKGGGFYEGRAW